MTGDLSVKVAEGMLNVRVGALLVRGNSVLMVHGSCGDYYTVGGRVRFGETMQSALMREISEELGNEAELLQGGELCVLLENFFRIDGVKFHELSAYYLFDASALTVKSGVYICDEKETLQWISLDEMKDLKLYPLFLKEEIPQKGKIKFLSIVEEDFEDGKNAVPERP